DDDKRFIGHGSDLCQEQVGESGYRIRDRYEEEGSISPGNAPLRGQINQAACFFGVIRPRASSSSAICTALSAAPLRRLSATTHRERPFSTVASSRMRLM